MKVVFKILALILLGLTITGCELLDPREWQRLKREDENGNMKECRKTPYENKRFTGCSGSERDIRGRICTYKDY